MKLLKRWKQEGIRTRLAELRTLFTNAVIFLCLTSTPAAVAVSQFLKWIASIAKDRVRIGFVRIAAQLDRYYRNIRNTLYPTAEEGHSQSGQDTGVSMHE